MPVKHNVSMQNPDLSGPTTHPRGDVLIKWLSLSRGMLAKHLSLGFKAVCSSGTHICQQYNPGMAGLHSILFKGSFKSMLYKAHSL